MKRYPSTPCNPGGHAPDHNHIRPNGCGCETCKETDKIQEEYAKTFWANREKGKKA